MENNLYSLCKKFNTDKLELGYVELYESYFKPLREKKLNILEIGVFTRENPYQNRIEACGQIQGFCWLTE